MKTIDRIKRKEIIRNLSSFVNIYKETIEPIMFPATLYKTYYSHLYEWVYWGDKFEPIEDHININDLLKGSLSYLSKDLFTCNINPIILSELTAFTTEDKKIFREYIKLGFYAGFDLLIDRKDGTLKKTYINCTMSLLNQEINKESLLSFLKNNGISVAKLEVITPFIQTKNYYNILREHFDEVKVNIEHLLEKYKTDILNFISQQLKNFQSQQIELFQKLLLEN